MIPTVQLRQLLLSPWSCLLWLWLAIAPVALAEPVAVIGVSHDAPTSSKRRVRIQLAKKAVFNVFRLNQPMRVVIDIADGQLPAGLAPQVIEDGVVEQIGFRQFTSQQVQIARVTMVFALESAYQVLRDGTDIVIEVDSSKGKSAEISTAPNWSLAAALNGESKSALPERSSPAASEHKSNKPELDTAAKHATAQASAHGLEQPLAPPLPIVAPLMPLAEAESSSSLPKGNGRLIGYEVPNSLSITIKIQGQLAWKTMLLSQPDRFVVDFPGITRGLRSRKIVLNKHQAIKRIRLGDQPQGTRLVMDLLPGTGVPVLRQQGNQLLLAFAKPTNERLRQPAELEQVSYLHGDQEVEQASLLLLGQGLAQPRLLSQSPEQLLLQFNQTTLGSLVPRSLDLSAYQGLLRAVHIVPQTQSVQIAVQLQQAVQATLIAQADGFTWQFAPKAALQSKAQLPWSETQFVGATMRAQQAGLEQEAEPSVQSQSAGLDGGAQGSQADEEDATEVVGNGGVVTVFADKRSSKRISIDVKDADIVNVLRLISEETGENIVASDDVRGKITLKLRNVPADQALDTMLRTKGFDKVRHHNILRIAPAESIQKERDLELLRKRSLAEVEETIIKMVTVNYASAKEIVDQVKPMLTSRGTVQVDERTNTIIVQEVASNVDRLVELTRRLDRQTPLVMIQARIVEAQVAYAQELGIQWGGTAQRAGRLGNPTGLMFPSDVIASGAADNQTGNQVGGIATPARFAVNLPANLGGSGGGIGLILGSAGGGDILNLRLTAMENNGNGKIISSPEVATLDNKTARISQGVKIPISVVSAAGTNTRFVDAKLELEVTPHVTNDGTVLMKISTKKSEPDFANRGAAGDPTIREKSAETEVLVRDGDTSVIGGIYTRTTSETYSEIPLLSRIPLLGLLFKRQALKDERAELLVFITPRIINRDESIVSGQAMASTPLGVKTP